MTKSNNKFLIICSCVVVLCILGALVCSVVLGLPSERSAEAASSSSSDSWVELSSDNSKEVLLSLDEDAVGPGVQFLSYYNLNKTYTSEYDPFLPIITSGSVSWGTPYYESSSYSDYFQALSFIYGKYYRTSFTNFNGTNLDTSAVEDCLVLGLRVRFDKTTGGIKFYQFVISSAMSNGVVNCFILSNSDVAYRYDVHTDYRVYGRSVLVLPNGSDTSFKSISSKNFNGYYGIPFNFHMPGTGESVNSFNFIPMGYVTDISKVPDSYKSTINLTNANAIGNSSIVTQIRSLWSKYYAVASKTYVANTSEAFYTDGFNKGYDRGYSEGIKDYKQTMYQDYEAMYNKGYNDGIAACADSSGEKFQKKYDDGFVAGKSAGYSSGYTAGAASAQNYTFMGLLGAVVDAPIKAFTGLLDFEVLGVNMSSFVLSMLTLSVIVIIIKICLGGK